MIIFQTVGCGTLGGLKLGAGLVTSPEPPATTFRSNEYIHRLNRTLQSETQALSAYVSLVGHRSHETWLEDGVEQHHQAGRDLVCLIIANRGVPEDRAALSLGLRRRLVQLCTIVPTRLADKVSFTSLLQLERQLTQHYERVLKIAPARDQAKLTQLLDSSRGCAQLVRTKPFAAL